MIIGGYLFDVERYAGGVYNEVTKVNAKWGGLESETGPRAPSPQDSKRTNDAWGSLSEH